MKGFLRCSRAAGVVSLTGLLVAGSLMPAQADPGYLQVSVDGQTYGPDLTGVLFGTGTGIVPGALAYGSVWVRNASPDAATLSLGAEARGSDPGFLPNLGLAVGSELGASGRTAFAGTDTCADMIRGWELSAGKSVRLDLVLDLAAEASNMTRGQSADLDVVILLQQQVPAVEAANACSAGTGVVRVAATRSGGDSAAASAAADVSVHAAAYVSVPAAAVPQGPAPARLFGVLEPAFGSLYATAVANRQAWGFALLTGIFVGLVMMEIRRRRENR